MSAIAMVSRFIMIEPKYSKSGTCDIYLGWVLHRQLLQQRLSLLQIARVEALSEPAVNRSKQVARLLRLTLVTPETREARRGTQLVSPRLLPSCDAQCFFEGDLALFEPAEAKERDAFKAMKLRVP